MGVDYIAKRFPRVQRERTTTSENSTDTSVNTSLQWEPTMTNAAIAALSSGEFVGLVADDPENQLELKTFHSRLKRSPEDDAPGKPSLPLVHKLGDQTTAEVFLRVKQDVEEMTDEVLARMMRDPRLAGLVVKLQ